LHNVPNLYSNGFGNVLIRILLDNFLQDYFPEIPKTPLASDVKILDKMAELRLDYDLDEISKLSDSVLDKYYDKYDQLKLIDTIYLDLLEMYHKCLEGFDTPLGFSVDW
jgi:hypothetical protein